jgi:hypothetical protein
MSLACWHLLQLDNPLHLYRLWDPEVRLQRRCLARNIAIMGEKVQALRKNPPAPHTIAGTQSWFFNLGDSLRPSCQSLQS